MTHTEKARSGSPAAAVSKVVLGALSGVPLSAFRPFLQAVMVAVAVAVVPASARAQNSAPARPDFRVLRFEENWGGFEHAGARSLLDRPKHIAIADSAGVYLSIGGQLRSRTETVSNFGLLNGAGNSDTFTLMRVLMHADLHAGEHLRFFVEGKHAIAIGRILPGGRRPLDHDELAVQNLFVDLSVRVGERFRATGRVGRQELLLGSQRLVSPLDWSNTRRTFEGLRLTVAAEPIVLETFAAHPVVVSVEERNRRDDGTLFWGGEVRPARPSSAAAWSLYLLGLSQNEGTFGGFTGSHERYTVGGRVTGAIGSAANRYDIESGWQTGSAGDGDISAWFVATDLTRSFPNTPLRPALTLGADYASGDGDPSDGRLGTFHQLFPLGHAYAGYMDLLGRQNLVEGRAVIALAPIPSIQFRGSVHRFLRASTEDAAYNVGGGPLRPADGEARAIGTELNLTAAYGATRHLRLEGGYGHFFPGRFMEESPAGGTSSHWFYMSTALTF